MKLLLFFMDPTIFYEQFLMQSIRGWSEKFRSQHEDGSTRKLKLVNLVVHLLTVTHQSFSRFGRAVVM